MPEVQRFMGVGRVKTESRTAGVLQEIHVEILRGRKEESGVFDSKNKGAGQGSYSRRPIAPLLGASISLLEEPIAIAR